MKRVVIEWSANIALADVAAQAFANARTSKHKDSSEGGRWIMRHWSVESLRFLWKNGDAENRASIAARVQIWMRQPQSSDRIRTREKDRLSPGYAKRQKRAAIEWKETRTIHLREVEKLGFDQIGEMLWPGLTKAGRRGRALQFYKKGKRRLGYVQDDQEPTGWRKAMQ